MQRVVVAILALIFFKAAISLQTMGARSHGVSDIADADVMERGAAAIDEGQPQPPKGVRDASELVAEAIKKHDIPGMAAVLIEGDAIVASGVAGVRERGKDAAITLGDKFHLGSCTKAMTATLCAILVQEGTLRWDMTIGEAFPELFKDAKAKDAWKGVTLRQLVNNRGGVPADLNADGLWARLWKFEGEPKDARRMLLEGVLKRDPAVEPGTKFLYANAGFAIAGHMAETKAGEPWETLLQQKVFTPLGITSAGYGAPGSKDVIDQPRGHVMTGGAMQPGRGADNPVAIGPAGIVHMTLADWGKFVALHVRGARGELRDNDPLKAEALKVLHEVPEGAETEYAAGWLVAKRPWAGGDGRVLTHNGSNTMWFSVVWIAPEKNFAVLAACNQGGDKGAKATDDAVSLLIQQWLKPK